MLNQVECIFDDMVDKEQAAQDVADAFVTAVKSHAEIKGKIGGRKQELGVAREIIVGGD